MLVVAHYDAIIWQGSCFRVHALGHLHSLIELDGVQVTSEEVSEAARMMAASHLSLTTLLDWAHTAREPTPSLSLLPIADQLYHSKTRPVYSSQPAMSASVWASGVSRVT